MVYNTAVIAPLSQKPKVFRDGYLTRRRFGQTPFKSLDGKTLQFIGDARPFKRCLSYQVG